MAGFRPKQARKAWLKIAMYGPAGSGKTLTSLLLAEGLAKVSGKRIAYVDTEQGTDWYAKAVAERRVHPEAFDFDALETRSIQEVTQAVRQLDTDEHGVVVLDSMTHLWESARNSYTGRKGKGGQIPMNAWAKIKAPYKGLETMLLNMPVHAIFCGRQGVDYKTDESTGEQNAVGFKMKAESESPYEPDFLFRMEAVRGKARHAVHTLFVDKDRSGVLRGQAIEWPSFDNVVGPLIPHLGLEHGHVQTAEDQILADTEASLEAEAAKEKHSLAVVAEYKAHFTLAKTEDELKAAAKSLTPAAKKTITSDAVGELKRAYQERWEQLS